MNEEEYQVAEKIYHQEGYDKGEYCHKQSFMWGFQEALNYLKNETKDKI